MSSTEVRYPCPITINVSERTRDSMFYIQETRGYETLGALGRRVIESYVLEHTQPDSRGRRGYAIRDVVGGLR